MDVEMKDSQDLAAAFRALGDPTRLGIFRTLCRCAAGVEVDEAGQCRPAGSLSVGEVCCRIGGSLSTISHHLKELRQAGLIRTERRGRWIYCSIAPSALASMRSFLDEVAAGGGEEPPTGCCETEGNH